jgi:hypothetical protein
MVEFNDRRYRADFSDGRPEFSMPIPTEDQQTNWQKTPVSPASKRDVHSFYRGHKDTQTWSEANRLAAKRISGLQFEHTNEYGAIYAHTLKNVLSERGLDLARKHGEIPAGR